MWIIMTSAIDEEFQFDTPVVLFGAAPVTAGVAACLDGLRGLPVIAADGGVHTALSFGLQPLAVIGDMDSADLHTELPAEIRQIRVSEQDDTDFEKCLNLIKAPFIVGVGFLDGRFDHALSVLNVMARRPLTQILLLIGASDLVLRLAGDCDLALEPGTRVSVWPLWHQEFIRSAGLEWPLDGLSMTAGRTVGTSNRVCASRVSIKAGAGDGYCLMTPPSCFAAFYEVACSLTMTGR
jgi:thiamine pyrophosphokinase